MASTAGFFATRARGMMIVFVAILTLLSSAAFAQSPVSDDTYVSSATPTTNNGNKAIICTRLPDDPAGATCTSSSPLAGPVQVRCDPKVDGPTCLNYRTGQVSITILRSPCVICRRMPRS